MLTMNRKITRCTKCRKVQNPLNKKCEYCGGKLKMEEAIKTK